MSSNHSRILVHKEGEEGAFFIQPMGNGDTASVSHDTDLPEWASNDLQGLATADLKERREWYTQRIGEEGFQQFASPDALAYQDLKWTAADAEGDLVEIEADHSWRSENLANLLGLDTSVEGFDKGIEGASVEIAVAETYRGDELDEMTLAEAEGKTFEGVEKQAKSG